MANVRQSDIAEQLGITQQAVAYALSDRPDYRKKLNSGTRQRILDTARQLGYVPHQAARNLRLGRTHEIVFATDSSLRLAYVHDLIEALQAALAERGYRLGLELFRQINEAPALYRTFTRGRCDGVVLHSLHPEHREAVESMQQRGMSFVVTNAFTELAVDTVDYDRSESARLGTAHLLAQGCARVALIVHGRGVSADEQRVAGYRQALGEVGRPFDESLILTGQVGKELQSLWQQIQSLTPAVTGLVCCNAELSAQLLGVMLGQGARVPEEMALVSLGDAEVHTLVEVPVTAVDNNPRGIATAVVERLLERMRNPQSPPQHILVKPFLVERESSGKREQQQNKDNGRATYRPCPERETPCKT